MFENTYFAKHLQMADSEIWSESEVKFKWIWNERSKIETNKKRIERKQANWSKLQQCVKWSEWKRIPS